MSVDDPEGHAQSAEIPYVLAIGLAHEEAATRLGEAYVLDEAARAKLMRLVVKIARNRLRGGHSLKNGGDIDALAYLSEQFFLEVKSGALA